MTSRAIRLSLPCAVVPSNLPSNINIRQLKTSSSYHSRTHATRRIHLVVDAQCDKPLEAVGRTMLTTVDGSRREREREREFIFHIGKTLEQVHNRNAKLGGLPERHLAHQSWPPIATIYCKYTVTRLYSQ